MQQKLTGKAHCQHLYILGSTTISLEICSPSSCYWGCLLFSPLSHRVRGLAALKDTLRSALLVWQDIYETSILKPYGRLFQSQLLSKLKQHMTTYQSNIHYTAKPAIWVDPLYIHGGSGKPTPESCPLTSTCTCMCVCVLMHVHCWITEVSCDWYF